MSKPTLSEAVSDVSELIATGVYRFYAHPSQQYALPAEAVVAVASFLVGAFCKGFLDHVGKKIAAIGEGAARQLWKDAKGQAAVGAVPQFDLDRLLRQARAAMHKNDSEALASAEHARRVVSVILIAHGYDADEAKSIALQISTIILAETDDGAR